MVMPRSRSSSIESSTCSDISRSARPPHIWMKRSASVDLPWSMWAMIEKFRMWLCGINKEGARRHPPQAAILAQLGDRFLRQSVAAELDTVLEQHWNVLAVEVFEASIGVDIDLGEGDAERPQGRAHLLAKMAIGPAVELNPSSQGRRS